uniref:Capsid protein n=1 Tax=Maize streak virus TaxID=10821 RepID=A0A1C6ZU53_9GEMI|nr:capsid protein [Maize streak virus]AIY33471.1 capsid protein [Maize streak virus]AIY33475.1 capsid protein [Maize streak virus]
MSTSKRKRGDDASWKKGTAKKKTSAAGLKKSATKAERPSLQIQTLLHAGTSMITVPSGGICDLISTYARGSDEGNRHTSETLTYKISLDYHFVADAASCKYSNVGTGVVWLVYDTTPGGQAPTTKQIFAYNDNLAAWPTTWKVSRELCHRFVVKRRWLFTMETDGRIGSDIPPSNVSWKPCKRNINFHKFTSGLGVRTMWKNVTDGGVGSIQRGALYMCIAPGNGVTFTAHGQTRLYFKSVGNQ